MQAEALGILAVLAHGVGSSLACCRIVFCNGEVRNLIIKLSEDGRKMVSRYSKWGSNSVTKSARFTRCERIVCIQVGNGYLNSCGGVGVPRIPKW